VDESLDLYKTQLKSWDGEVKRVDTDFFDYKPYFKAKVKLDINNIPYFELLFSDGEKDTRDVIRVASKPNVDYHPVCPDWDIINLRDEVQGYILNNKPQATELIVKDFLKHNKIYSIRNDDRDEMWIYKDGIYTPDAKTYIQEFVRHILLRRYTTHLFNGVVSKIQADTYIHQKDFFINEDKNLIPVNNGILDIKTKQLVDFSDKYRFFNKIPVNYVENAEKNIYQDFFLNILRNANDVLIIQELFGYALYRDFPIHKCFMFNGNGRNGKGKTLELLKLFVSPENCTDLSMSDMEEDNFTINRLHNKLLNLSGDIDGGFIKQSGLFKKLTGGDLVTSKRKFKTDLSFTNFSKMVFACNHLPNFGDDSHGFWERWILLDFPYTFLKESDYNSHTEEDRIKKKLKVANPDILKELMSEENKPALLNWALQGLYRIINKRQFSESSTREEVQKEWKRKSSPMYLFVEAMCVENYSKSMSYTELTQEYLTFCKQNNLKPESKKSYEITLKNEFGVYMGRKTDGMHYIGIGLKTKLM